MGFPDRIERTVELAHPPATVWTALTTADGLRGWFGDEAVIDLRPGGAARVAWTGDRSAELRVERVEEPAVFGFTWQVDGVPEDDPRRTYVEFTLQPHGGGTRLTVVESGFAQLPDEQYDATFQSHLEGWPRELGELAAWLDAG
ncbi:SRPBCC domain-containing protein [Amycolatopsis jejuensis]|uniref:SRPBCC domain-containing protein n=1 Tax=Amycolatopsis jejuensis TaxID=330084 RepID=UPI000525DC87|nr:SRPBCC domain-containing protein [Amycolatopsis jejuensis]